MKSPEEILVVHHSHTDWGYTTHQSVIGENHLRFIDQAVELCRGNENRPKELRYRWTCETAFVVQQYLRDRSPRQRRAFLKCIEAGDMEVAGLPLHPTPLADKKTITATLGILDELRQEGIPVSVAVGCDINGLTWPWADALLDAGVTGLGMAMNYVCGGGMDRWQAFRWKSPQGKLLLTWQGTHYNYGAYWGLNHNAYPISQVAPYRIAELKRIPYEKLLLQVTNIPPDNMGPHPSYIENLQTYNRLAQEKGWPLMRTALLRDWFDFLESRAKSLPIYEGDWTDWWASGAGSTPRETASLMEAQRRIGLAENKGLAKEKSVPVRRAIFLAAEHTWGASSGVRSPYQASSMAGLAAKQTLIYNSLFAATHALRDSLPAGARMHDKELESFDPTWATIVDWGANKGRGEPPPSVPMVPPLTKDTAPDWKRWTGKSFARVILEETPNGDRETWYERNKKFDLKNTQYTGKWVKNAPWKRKVLREAKVTRTVEGSVLRLDVRFNLPTTSQPRAIYIEFPFSLQPSAVAADVGGAWADPRSQYVPGSCLNWWTVHNGVLLSSPKGSILWTSWDAPLVMFDDICPNPLKRKISLRRPVLVSWAMNTYWFTNFWGISGGDYQFRYRVKYWPHAVSAAEAEAFCQSDPLPAYPSVIPPQVA